MSSPGLRERKKAKTRRTIQEHALRLFAERGYDSTTVEQIADAAEVSPSTFFRYFPTKEDVVLQDDYDPILVEAFLRQPPELDVIPALRASLREAFTDLYAETGTQLYERVKLQFDTPALRARTIQDFFDTMQVIAEATSTRTGRDVNDSVVQTFAGTFLGAAFAAMNIWMAGGGKASLPELLDDCLAHIENGLKL